jgi:hypothetical protein
MVGARALVVIPVGVVTGVEVVTRVGMVAGSTIEISCGFLE